MAGFYKNDNGTLLEAPNSVTSKDYELVIAKKDSYSYPVDGWKYFDTREAALAEYGIVEKKDEEAK
jgi:hypothetical protein